MKIFIVCKVQKPYLLSPDFLKTQAIFISIPSDDKPLKMEENFFFVVFVWTASENLDLDIINLSFLYLKIDSDASVDLLSNVNGMH